jgi:hypothetical protein
MQLSTSHPIEGGKAPSPLVGEGVGDEYFRVKYYGAFGQRYENSLLNGGQAKTFSWKCARG